MRAREVHKKIQKKILCFFGISGWGVGRGHVHQSFVGSLVERRRGRAPLLPRLPSPPPSPTKPHTLPSSRMGCLSSPIFERAFDVCEQLEVRHAAGRGLGLFAKGAIRKGTVLFRELPLVCMQEASRTPCLVCERCCRFVGPLEAQIRALLRAQYPVDGSLPHVDGMRQLPLPEPCLGGCTMLFCSEACARAEYAQGHSLLCPGPAAATNQSEDQRAAPSAHRERGQLESMIKSFGLASGSSGASKSMVADAFSVQYHQRGDGKEGRGGTSGGKRAAASSAVEEEEGDGPQEEGDVSILDSASSPLERFERHARATNPIFLLAAKAMAGVIVQCNSGVSLEAAMQAYPGPPWWDAVPPPTGHDAVAFCETLRRLVTQSWLLLCAVLTRNQVEPTTGSGNSAVAAFSNPTLYATIVGSFERRNCALAVSSPVEEYFLRVDAMAEGPAKAAATAATAPLLESLGSRYRTHCEGSGLFTAQVCRAARAGHRNARGTPTVLVLSSFSPHLLACRRY